ncbi:MAG: 2,3,4,5-tetrahydropyridine-2,6-dicarboxylate N-succinyltransferase [Bdellovibrionota bacterium]
MADTQKIISDLYARPGAEYPVANWTASEKAAIHETLEQLDQGRIRVCTKDNGQWITHEWIKKAILLFFRMQPNELLKSDQFQYYDKVQVKKWTGTEGVRVVPPAVVRKGAFIESGAILMPSYVNIGAFVGSGTMVDTWATVGSCAQIGKNVHLAGGVGIGGVLEPAQAQPVIIEDECFLGSRSIVVEGVHLEEGVVLGAGVVITGSTKIIDVTGSSPVELKKRIPKNSVVIPGTSQKEFAAGSFGVPCALIIGKRTESTDKKVSLNSALRDFNVSV